MKNTNIFIALAVITLLLVGVVYYANHQKESSYTATPPPSPSSALPPSADASADDTASINTDLEQIDAGNVEGEFTDIDRDINSL